MLSTARASANAAEAPGLGAPIVLTPVIVMLLLLATIRRREVQKSLEKCERRLDLALQVSRDGLWDWNLTRGLHDALLDIYVFNANRIRRFE